VAKVRRPVKSSRPQIAALLVLITACAAAATWMYLKGSGSEAYSARPKGTVTFHKDIEPIFRQRCVGCHRPGQSGPFSLIAFEDIRKRSKQIADVTTSRYMPPWLPEPGYGEFAGERRLTVDELGLIQQWIREGAVEGKPDGALAPLPSDEWQLGKPDLIVTLPEPYVLDPAGKDVYRNVVAPVPSVGNHFVRAFEFKPNSKTVHHAFVYTDRTRQSRRRLGGDKARGFDGMDTPPGVDGPSGFFSSWQPGKRVSEGNAGLSWPLGNNSDLLFQLHMKPSGKPEPVQPSVGLYFTDEPPTNTPFKICLTSMQIDIPAGANDYTIEDSYTLPIELDVLGVLPHAHYLCKEMRGVATLPDGTRKELLWIRQWNFDWQGDYRYKSPIFLPKGTKMEMKFTYDNSAKNIRNPNSPPQRVRYGVQSSDEMGELWFQVLPRNRNDLPLLTRDYSPRLIQSRIDYNFYRLRLDPSDARAHAALGSTYLMAGRTQDAYPELQKAIRLDPSLDDPHYYLGLLYRYGGKLAEAKVEFEKTITLSPEHGRAYGNLGLVLLQLNDLQAAEQQFLAALRINADDAIAHDSLGLIMMQNGRLSEAEEHLRAANRINPEDAGYAQHLASLLQLKNQRK
jgi:Flp pilus assembly protein TadD